MNSAITLPVVGAVLVGLLGLIGVWRTARVARQANDRSTAIDGWQEWRNDAKALREERDAERARYEAKLVELDRRLTAECDGKVRLLDDRLTAMITDYARAEERHRREMLMVHSQLEQTILWIRRVVPIMRERQLPFPDLPPGILDTDPGVFRALPATD